MVYRRKNMRRMKSKHRAKVKRMTPTICGMERDETGFTCKQCGASWIDPQMKRDKPSCLYGLNS